MKFKRFLCMALSILMLVSMLPAAAAEGPAEEPDDIEIVDVEEPDGKEGVTPPSQPVGLNYGYYLIGRYGWTIDDLVESRDKFEQNYESTTTEYKLMTTLEEGQQIKVVLVSNGTQLGPWYPGGDNYTVDAAHAGTKIIYFRPDYNSDWAAFGGHFYITDPPTYHVNVTQPLHGMLVPDKYDAAEGETITVTAVPDPGYYPAQQMKCIPFPSNTSWPDAYHFCFTMPAYDVTVSIGWDQMCVDEGFYYSVDTNVMDLTPAQKFTAVSSAYGEYEYEAVLEEGNTLDLTRITTSGSWSSGYLRWDFSTETPWTEGDSPWLITAEKAGHAKIFLSSTNGEGYTKAFDKLTYQTGTSDMWLIVKYYQPITVLPTEHGTVTAPADAFEDDTVCLTVTPDEGYVLDTLTVTDANGNELYLHGVNGTNFYMPATAATVSATFKPDVASTYTVTLVGAREGVTITSTKETAKEGDTVDVNIRTDSYHRFVSITVTDDQGNEIETTKRPDGANKYRFTMPASDVTVTVVTKEIYPLFLVNTQVDEYNCTDILGDGSASYDPTTRTLSFSSANPNFGTAYGSALIEWNSEQTLTVEAPNGVDLAGNATYCLYANSGDVVINGDVILDIPDESNGIWCMKTLTINGNVSGTVKAIALYGLNGITVNGNVNITNQEGIRTAYSIGTVSISGDFTTVGLGIDAMGGISIGGSVTITSSGTNEYGLLSSGGAITVGSGVWDITASSCPLKAAGGIVIPEGHSILLPEGGVLGTLTESGTNYTVVYEADGTTKATHVIISGQPAAYTVAVSAFSGGTVAADKESALEGETVTLTVTADTGRQLAALYYIPEGSDEQVFITETDENGNYIFTMPAANVTVGGAFEMIEYFVTVADGIVGGTITPSAATATFGSTVTLTVTVDEGYSLSGLQYTADGGETWIDIPYDAELGYIFTMPAANVTVGAEFEAIQYSITVPEGIIGGSVVPSAATATVGSTVTLTVSANPGYSLSELQYTSDGGETWIDIPYDAELGYSFTMPAANVTIAALFEANVYSVTVDSNLPDAVSVDPLGACVGQLITIWIDQQYRVTEAWYTVEGGEEQVPLTFSEEGYGSFTMPAGNVTVHVQLTEKTFTVFIDFGGGHDAFAEAFFPAIADQYSDAVLDHETIRFTVPVGTIPVDILLPDGNGLVTDPVENSQCFMYSFGLKPRSGYANESEYMQEHSSDAMQNPMTGDISFYALWAEPAGAVVTVNAPECGTEVHYEFKTGIYVWSVPQPDMTVSGDCYFENYDMFFNSWDLSDYGSSGVNDPPVVMTGDHSYKAIGFLRSSWGYYFAGLDGGTLQVIGAQLSEHTTNPSPYYINLVVEVPVEHERDEHGVCIHCGDGGLADGYYLIGPDWSVYDIDPENKFEENESNPGEYQLNVTLAVGDEIKVVYVTNGAISAWYPDGEHTQYIVDEAHSGSKTIYFKTTYDSAWDEFGGYFFIEANPVVMGHHITVTDYTKGLATTSLDPEALYSGEVSFTVTADQACALGVLNEDGTITRLSCTTSDDVHSFTVTVSDADLTIILIFRGDADMNGKVQSKDATLVKQVVVETKTLPEGTAAIQIFAVDLNSDGAFQSREATMISQVVVESKTYDW